MRDGRIMTTVGLLDESAQLTGASVITVLAKRGLLLFKSALCFFVCILLLLWTDFDAFSGTLPWYRAMIPLFLAAIAAGFGLFFLLYAGKRLELMEDGIRYRTLFFKLEVPYSQIVRVQLSLEDGKGMFAGNRRYSYHSASPVSMLSLSLSDGRNWSFGSNFFRGLEQADIEMKKRMMHHPQ